MHESKAPGIAISHESKESFIVHPIPIVHMGLSQESMKAQPVGHIVRFSVSAKM